MGLLSFFQQIPGPTRSPLASGRADLCTLCPFFSPRVALGARGRQGRGRWAHLRFSQSPFTCPWSMRCLSHFLAEKLRLREVVPLVVASLFPPQPTRPPGAPRSSMTPTRPLHRLQKARQCAAPSSAVRAGRSRPVHPLDVMADTRALEACLLRGEPEEPDGCVKAALEAPCPRARSSCLSWESRDRAPDLTRTTRRPSPATYADHQ